jgi:hypothetical protein
VEPAQERPDADDILVVCASCGHIEDFHRKPDQRDDGTWCLALDCGCVAWVPKPIAQAAGSR